MQIGSKVMAIKNTLVTSANVFGEGKYLGQQIPDVSPFKEMGLRNPVIKLEGGVNDGKLVWGFQCWWGEAEKARADLDKKNLRIVEVKIEDHEEVAIYHPDEEEE